MEKLHRILENPVTDIVTALILIITSLSEGWETFIMDITEFKTGVHHGVLLFGILMLVRGVVEALETLSRKFGQHG